MIIELILLSLLQGLDLIHGGDLVFAWAHNKRLAPLIPVHLRLINRTQFQILIKAADLAFVMLVSPAQLGDHVFLARMRTLPIESGSSVIVSTHILV